MGAFFLYHKSTQINEANVDELYIRKGFKKPYSFLIGDYYLKLFKKQLIDIPNYYTDNTYNIFVCGSLFYKDLSYGASLKELLSDFINNKLDAQKLRGSYVILFYNSSSNEILFYIDPAFIKNVFFDPERKIISSNFLALIEAIPDFYSIDRLAVIENITTGHLISPDTYVAEVKKLDKVNFSTLEFQFPGIYFNLLIPSIIDSINNRDEAINYANQQLSEYFKGIRKLTDEFGAHIGLTGGFDSRLLLMHGRKYLSNLVTNSFWRPESLDYQNAKELAGVAGLKFYSFEKESFEKPCINEMLHDSFYFLDGQIRSQNRWDEEFSLAEYNASLTRGYNVGFHGCGGEQYRNADHFYRPKSLRSFILYSWMFRQCEDPFLDDDLKWQIYNNIEKKIRRITGIGEEKVDLYILKHIQNEIWNSANRTFRMNVLNQQQFYFAPFTEYSISNTAYKFVPFLGKSLSFQIEMMRRVDKQLSSVKTNYGFNLLEGESLLHKLIPFFINWTPMKLFNKFYFLTKRNLRIQGNPMQFNTVGSCFFNEHYLQVNFKKLLGNVNLAAGLASLCFFLDEMKDKIKL